jgi:TatD DNase family protein
MTESAPSPRLIDSHAHLDDVAFERDVVDVIERARIAGVTKIVNIGYRPAIWRSTIALARTFPEIAYTLGLHPNHADEDAEPIWHELRRLMKENRPVAIGEIGLDYFRDYASKATQLHIFDRQLALADEFGLPVVIHQRDAEDDVRRFLRNWSGAKPWVLHSFDGSRDFADEALAAGAYIGIGGLMTRAGSDVLRETLKTVAIERILLETDSPYLVPRGLKSRRNEPANVARVANALAELLARPSDEIARTTTANAERVFGLHQSAVA